MSRKFSIIATIDLSKMDDEIGKYVDLNGNFDPYIFMNEDTVKAIEDEVGVHDIMVGDVDLSNKRNTKDGIYATYSGYKNGLARIPALGSQTSGGF